MAVENLPSKWNGVFFLENAFTACIVLNSGGMLREVPDIRQLSNGAPMAGYARVYRWNEKTLQFDRIQ
jgi:hypothetical protein